MPRKLLKRLALAFLLVVSNTGWSSTPSGPSSPARPNDSVSSRPTNTTPEYLLRPDKVLDSEASLSPVALPRRGFLLALSRWGSTTLAVFDASTKELIPFTTAGTGELLVSPAAGRIAYLVREGVTPTKNYIQIADLKKRKTQIVKPADDFAFLGFSLSQSGERLAYAQINLRRSRSDRLFWRLGLADLSDYETHVVFTSGQDIFPREEMPVPFASSASTGKIYLQGLLPFRGMATRGIWSMSTDGSGMRRILPGPSYTGLPRLSFAGTNLAYLSSSVEAMPRDYIAGPGAPPGNILAVTNLHTGEQSILSRQSAAAYGVFAWSATGKEILVSRQEWREGRFQDAALLKVSKGSLSELLKIAPSPTLHVTGIDECSGSDFFFWVEQDDAGARLLGAKAAGGPSLFLAFPEGKIHLIGCIGA